MTLTQQIVTIGVVVLGTLLTRFLPFCIFPAGKSTPKYVQYLGKVLPASVFALLVVYCLKDVSWDVSPYGIPEGVGVVVTAALHLWKRQMLFSIAGGTLVYMFLVQFVFV